MNRCFVCRELSLHMVSVSQHCAFAKMRSGAAGSYFKANRLGCLGPQNVLCRQAQIAEFSELDHGFKEKTLLAIYPSIWCALILCLKKIDKTES